MDDVGSLEVTEGENLRDHPAAWGKFERGAADEFGAFEFGAVGELDDAEVFVAHGDDADVVERENGLDGANGFGLGNGARDVEGDHRGGKRLRTENDAARPCFEAVNDEVERRVAEAEGVDHFLLLSGGGREKRGERTFGCLGVGGGGKNEGGDEEAAEDAHVELVWESRGFEGGMRGEERALVNGVMMDFEGAERDLFLAGIGARLRVTPAMANSFGHLFRITTWGESHGPAIGVVIDGCPPRLPISAEEIQAELRRRQPGQSEISTPRKEADAVEILSGVFEGKTTGAPIALMVRNTDQRAAAYEEIARAFRPSHADFTWQTKFGIRDPNGGGRSSARETIGRVAAGAIAKKILALAGGVEVRAFVSRVHDVAVPEGAVESFPTLAEVEANAVRCPHGQSAEAMIERIKSARDAGDSVGGVVECRVRNAPVGLGEPVFDRLEADLAKAMLSLPASKGFEIGSGFDGSLSRGSAHNDVFEMRDGKIRTATNRSGGVQGGVSNGEEIRFRVAFKPTPTIAQKQRTVDVDGNAIELAGKGRHDPCVVPRAVVIVEAMAALTLLDHWMRDAAQNKIFDF